ncbi:ribulose-phosphate 3-epimerase [Thermorudis peleae]|uniref:ribulose-phosphate 3-epimerase n=1 Tax=Thermorudis peleae TaxID=1382356 RepID=UPI0009E01560|nr:ribulose-phosphate 3-epimerase [Thermorudis peleae]
MSMVDLRSRLPALAPSILDADFACLADAVRLLEAHGADFIHLDVMDGRFVPNISFGLPVVSAVRRLTRLPLDVHLMIVEPERYVEAFIEAGATIVTVHAEVSPHLHRTVQLIHEHGARAGVALNPATPLALIEEILPFVDVVLVMTVNPGFGGQTLIPSVLQKVRRLRARIDEQRLPAVIEIDGGIKPSNVGAGIAAGADVLVTGSAVFHADDPAAVLHALRTEAQRAWLAHRSGSSDGD